MGGENCAVPKCYNYRSKTNDRDPPVHYYPFPKDPKRREIWTRFVSRYLDDNKTDWLPGKKSTVCSDHFAGGEKSRFPNDLAYNPTLHPCKQKKRVNPETARSRTNRNKVAEDKKVAEEEQQQLLMDIINEPEPEIEPKTREISTQTENPITIENGLAARIEGKMTMFLSCVTSTDAQTQVTHEYEHIVSDQMVQTNPKGKSVEFFGYKSVKESTKLQELTTVDQPSFNMFLDMLFDYNPRFYSKEDFLLVFLLKLKFGLPFLALSILFGIKRSTMSENFYAILERLYRRTRPVVYWPDRNVIDITMPECFKKNYPKCRVIIDCSEVKCQKPAGTDEQFVMYSHYKSGHTIKFLVAIAPNGMFSYISLAYGGRTSDTFITGHCDLIDLLEPFDLVLADKGFPTLKCDDIVTVIPPRGKSGQQASTEDMELTRKIASVRIEVERSIQRLKIYKILSNTFHLSLLPEVNKIIHVCAVLANLQPPITNPSSGQPGASEEESEDEGELERPEESDLDSDDSLDY